MSLPASVYSMERDVGPSYSMERDVGVSYLTSRSESGEDKRSDPQTGN